MDFQIWKLLEMNYYIFHAVNVRFLPSVYHMYQLQGCIITNWDYIYTTEQISLGLEVSPCPLYFHAGIDQLDHKPHLNFLPSPCTHLASLAGLTLYPMSRRKKESGELVLSSQQI